jgi:hypothetical protein
VGAVATYEYRIRTEYREEDRLPQVYENDVQWSEEMVRDYCSQLRDIPVVTGIKVWRRPIATWYPWDWETE